MLMINLRRTKIKLIVALTFIISSLFLVLINWTTIRIQIRDVIYLTRPIWDKQPKQWNYLYHFSSEQQLGIKKLCRLHNWTLRHDKIKVYDAVIFSVELDLLEIRLKELWDQVDRFIVLEADRTFTGKSKELLLKENIERFDWAKDKLTIKSFTGLRELSSHESPFVNENRMRLEMTTIIDNSGVQPGDLIIVSDVDEIPSSKTIELFKRCTGYPMTVHLELKTYVTSFEFYFAPDDSWRAHVQVYSSGFYYSHGRQSDVILPNSGWHCTFCFRFLNDFIFKMTSYSHNDRVTHEGLLDKNQLQQRICQGRDVYEMFPEVYSFKEMIIKFGDIKPSKSLTNLPKYLLQHPERFKFLLPGGCIRES